MTLLEKLRKMEKTQSKSWQYDKPGDCIGGETLTDLRTVDTKYGKRKAIDLRSEEDGQTYTVWAKTVIANELTRKNVKKGDEVGIKFLGPRKNYNDFVVVVEKREPKNAADVGHPKIENQAKDDAQEDTMDEVVF